MISTRRRAPAPQPALRSVFFFYSGHLGLVQFGQARKQATHTDLQSLADFENRDGRADTIAQLQVAHRLPMDARHVAEAALCEIGPQTCRFHVPADSFHHLAVCHPTLKTFFLNKRNRTGSILVFRPLTTRVLKVKNIFAGWIFGRELPQFRPHGEILPS